MCLIFQIKLPTFIGGIHAPWTQSGGPMCSLRAYSCTMQGLRTLWKTAASYRLLMGNSMWQSKCISFWQQVICCTGLSKAAHPTANGPCLAVISHLLLVHLDLLALYWILLVLMQFSCSSYPKCSCSALNTTMNRSQLFNPEEPLCPISAFWFLFLFLLLIFLNDRACCFIGTHFIAWKVIYWSCFLDPASAVKDLRAVCAEMEERFVASTTNSQAKVCTSNQHTRVTEF